MVKSIMMIVISSVFTMNAMAQAYDENTVDTLDELDRQRVLLQKQLDVVKLEGELRSALATTGATSVVDTEDMQASALSLIKVTGLEKKPQAVFTYGGYRIVTSKGDMVLPNIQVSSVEPTHVILKDITTGKQSLLWLSSDTQKQGTTTNTAGNPS